MSGMSADAKLWSRFLERIEFSEKFCLGQLPLRKAAFGLVVGVDEVLDMILLVRVSCICTTYLVGWGVWFTSSSTSYSG